MVLLLSSKNVWDVFNWFFALCNFCVKTSNSFQDSFNLWYTHWSVLLQYFQSKITTLATNLIFPEKENQQHLNYSDKKIALGTKTWLNNKYLHYWDENNIKSWHFGLVMQIYQLNTIIKDLKPPNLVCQLYKLLL